MDTSLSFSFCWYLPLLAELLLLWKQYFFFEQNVSFLKNTSFVNFAVLDSDLDIFVIHSTTLSSLENTWNIMDSNQGLFTGPFNNFSIEKFVFFLACLRVRPNLCVAGPSSFSFSKLSAAWLPRPPRAPHIRLSPNNGSLKEQLFSTKSNEYAYQERLQILNMSKNSINIYLSGLYLWLTYFQGGVFFSN